MEVPSVMVVLVYENKHRSPVTCGLDSSGQRILPTYNEVVAPCKMYHGNTLISSKFVQVSAPKLLYYNFSLLTALFSPTKNRNKVPSSPNPRQLLRSNTIRNGNIQPLFAPSEILAGISS